MVPGEVYLGNIFGLNTHAIPYWEEHKEEKYNDFKTVYDIVLLQYKHLLRSNIFLKLQIANFLFTEDLVMKFKKIDSFKLYFIVSAVSFGLLMLLFIIASFKYLDCLVLALVCLMGVVLNIKFLKDYERGINNE